MTVENLRFSEKNLFPCLKIGIVKILSLSCVQICIYLLVIFIFGFSAPIQRHTIGRLCKPKKHRYFCVMLFISELALIIFYDAV